ncbi:hypothetical protein [Burkholderia sp. Ac-20365]|uniref:hypothetical protein n=1 Tax=Burkholderia sp. Ac-20365 TaxID=2703897 RepID=UPI00197B1189|nr:hypothetical protein [Burkholderia sp. Ac-20365]MBN3761342.1 hypothetical protein [Burkholderia sp. Ac-20365]
MSNNQQSRPVDSALANVPRVVQEHVGWILNRLRDHEFALSGVERARGKGHILALELRDRQAKIEQHREQLEEFRQLAAQNGVDADAAIAELGGQPDFSRFGKPATH